MSPTDYKNIKVIGFDLDQTLYPKSAEIDEAIQKYLYKEISNSRKIGLEEAKSLFTGMYHGQGLSGGETMRRLGFPRDRAANLVQEALENADIAKFLKPKKTTVELLRKIKGKYKFVDLITGSNERNAKIKLEKLKIPLEIFANTITGDQATKSDLSAFHLWLSLYPRFKADNFLYIGDRVSMDYEKPKELGIKSILVNIASPHPDVTCPQLPSLLSLKEFFSL